MVSTVKVAKREEGKTTLPIEGRVRQDARPDQAFSKLRARDLLRPC